MKQIWNLLKNRYFNYILLGIFVLFKVSFNYFGISNLFLLHSDAFQKIIIVIGIISLTHLLLIWFINILIFWRYNQSIGTWQNNHKETTIGKLENVFQKPSIMTIPILLFGSLSYLVLIVFSWTDIIAILGGMVLATIVRTIYQRRKLKKQVIKE